jgi:hypothetical protein
MRQQLRLRVLVPVAVLGLLGAGFGAFAMGGPSEPESIPVLPASSGIVETGATDTGATDTAPAPSPPPAPTAGEVDPATWAQQANALCAQFNEQGEALGQFESPKQAEEWFANALELVKGFEADFVALGWPTGGQASVLKVQMRNSRAVESVERFLAAIKARDGKRLIELTDDEPADKTASKQTDAVLRELGATECTKDFAEDWQLKRTSALLQWQLMTYPAVVVVFYSPESDLDKAAVLEARAASLETDAGFVAVDVTDEKQVAAFATGFEVAGSPTVLVISRGPRLRSAFTGIVDRETVAQAVANSRR